MKTLKIKEYNFILMDVQMPEMDGIEVTLKIRSMSITSQPIIVAVTANAMQGDREKCIQAGMDDYISKPIKLEEIIEVLKRWSSTLTTTSKK